jgi:predicted nucleic acid-binding protein
MYYFFLDASAVGKRYVIEVGTHEVNHLFNTVPRMRMVVLILTLGEIASILVRRRNAGHISRMLYQQAMAEFRSEVAESPDLLLQAVTSDRVLGCALEVAEALRIIGDDLVLVTSDIRLANAGQATGLLTWNPEKDTQSALDGLVSV